MAFEVSNGRALEGDKLPKKPGDGTTELTPEQESALTYIEKIRKQLRATGKVKPKGMFHG